MAAIIELICLSSVSVSRVASREWFCAMAGMLCACLLGFMATAHKCDAQQLEPIFSGFDLFCDKVATDGSATSRHLERDLSDKMSDTEAR